MFEFEIKRFEDAMSEGDWSKTREYE